MEFIIQLFILIPVFGSLLTVFVLFVPVYIVGVILMYTVTSLPPSFKAYLPIVLTSIGLLMSLKSFTERKHVLKSWLLVFMNHCWIALAISFNERFDFSHVALYLSGVVCSRFWDTVYFTV
jgi:NADH-quinone oxidoreductase subunit L